MVEAVGRLGLEVRAGLHTGEIEMRGDDVGGVAVHIGARVGALAGPSEVLVSSTVRDLIVGAGASGALGVRTATKATDSGPLGVEVRYPAVTRAGLPVSIEIAVGRDGGFDGPVQVAVSGRWLALFDENGLDPEPWSATADGDAVRWSFEPPAGDVLVVSLDARTEPGVQWGRRAWVSVPGDGGPVRVDIETRVFP